MMLVTTSRNDEDLRVQLRKKLGNIPVFTGIPHGDINIYGLSLNRESCRVLMERKKMGDIISCIETGRYLAQWQNAREAGWEKQYLFAEIGRNYKEGRDGLVWVRKGKKWMVMRPEIEWHRVDAFLYEVREYLGVQVVRTESVRHTAKEVVRLYALLSKPPEEHYTLKKMFSPAKPSEGLMDMFRKPTVARRVAKELSHIGWELSEGAVERFGSVRAMVNATEEEWQEIPKVGKKIAGDIVKELETDWRDGSRPGKEE